MAAKFTEASTIELVICKPIVWIGGKKQKCRKHKLPIKLEPVCKGQLQKQTSRFSLSQSQGTESVALPHLFL